jgi:hypothetical protein
VVEFRISYSFIVFFKVAGGPGMTQPYGQPQPYGPGVYTAGQYGQAVTPVGFGGGQMVQTGIPVQQHHMGMQQGAGMAQVQGQPTGMVG